MKDFFKRSNFKFRLMVVSFPVVMGLFALLLMQGQSYAASPEGLSAVANEITVAPQSELGAIQAGFVTTITINTTEDITAEDQAENNENKHTCNFTQGAFFFPANGSSAGLCTLRRAILEASARPQSDRPILIRFDIPDKDPNADLEVAGTWTIKLDEALPILETDSVANLNGQVTIDGSTQPGIRNDGPGVIIDTGNTTLQILSTDNVIRGISWKNGGSFQTGTKAHNNVFEDIWMGLSDDGQKIAFRDQNDFKALATDGFFIRSDGNTIQNNVITGSADPAVRIDSGDDNQISGNLIGTRADGTIPAVSEVSECNASNSYDPALWYGGLGIELGGSRNEVTNNVLVNLHIMRTPNETSPVAIVTSGKDHTITNNRIGVDANDVDEGVCGHGIQIVGSGHEIAENVIAKSRISFEDGEEAAMFSRDGSPNFGQNLIYGNVIRDSPGSILIFTGNINSSLKFFKPARITSINGSVLEGRAEDGFPCPNCRIDFYLDDVDEIEEALDWLGTTTADADGKFTFDMGKPIPAGLGIRTMATTNNSGVIGSFGPNTSSEASQLYTPITDLTFTGPTTGFTGVPYQINFQVHPVAVTLPITYSVDITDEPNTVTSVLDDRLANVVYSWSTPGTKTIEVTADNGLSKLTKSYQIEIEQAVVEGAITDIVFSGPTTGEVNTEYEFFFTMEPADVATPFDILLEVTDKTDLTGSLSTRNGRYTTGGWSTGGTKTIKVTASNGINSLSKSFQIVINEPDPTPTTPEPSVTPGSTPSTPEPTSTPAPTSTASSPSSSDKFIFLPLVVR